MNRSIAKAISSPNGTAPRARVCRADCAVKVEMGDEHEPPCLASALILTIVCVNRCRSMDAKFSDFSTPLDRFAWPDAW